MVLCKICKKREAEPDSEVCGQCQALYDEDGGDDGDNGDNGDNGDGDGDD